MNQSVSARHQLRKKMFWKFRLTQDKKKNTIQLFKKLHVHN